jgi:hypothetical protein
MTDLTNIQKKLYVLPEFIRTQEDTLKIREKEFLNYFEKIMSTIDETYDLFIHRKKIDEEWMSFIKDLDDQLENSLK